MNRKVLFSLLTTMIILGILLSACQPAPIEETPVAEAPVQEAPATEEPETEAPAAEAPAEEAIKVALVLSGPISDASWNAAAYNALLSLKDMFNLEIEYTENTDLPDIEPTYRGYADSGFDVIIGHGFQFSDPAFEVAPAYPETHWGIVMGYAEGDNIESMNFKEEETSYLAGFVAASMSETGVIGGVGGMDIPSIIKMMEAYKLGAKSVNPDIEVLVTYVGVWDDPTAGYEATLAQINQNADVVFTSANLTSVGVYQAAEEKGVFAIGSEGDQCGAATDTVLATITDNFDKVMELMIRSVQEGNFNGGVNFYGLKEGAISYFACEGMLPADVESEAENLKQQIIDGSLVVPTILEISD
ncbi:MAG: BMP family ABC transporter substrate-binding protein [Anaerolineales bacterium]|nr:MAG: BMP family ABC transporter substrate-binding protein [Anaerolineales bacterium]